MKPGPGVRRIHRGQENRPGPRARRQLAPQPRGYLSAKVKHPNQTTSATRPGCTL